MPRDNDGPLAEFFAQFPGFVYDPSECATNEYARLRNFKKWTRDSPVSKEYYERFRDALVRQFNKDFGTDDNDLDLWIVLFGYMGLKSPDTVEHAKQIIGSIHVNMIDLMDAYGKNETIKRFKNEKALSEYTLDTYRIFPRENAFAGSLLQCLLRHIYHPRDHRSKTKKRRNNRK